MIPTAKRILAHIQTAKHILLVPHQHPDGDALGSITALMGFFETTGQSFDGFCATDIAPVFDYLPHIHRVKQDTALWDNPLLDTVIVCDSGDLTYAGIAAQIENKRKKLRVLNIDHHKTNQRYGDENLVIPTAASTTEILYTFFALNHVSITGDMATSLLTGLVTDTDSFTNAATSRSALAAASALLNRGANVSAIHSAFVKDKNLRALALWGTVFDRLQYHKEEDVVSTFVTQRDQEQAHVSDNEAEGLSNYLNNLAEGRARFFLKEVRDRSIKCSFRTTRNDVDVSAWAKALGGGGHQKAAGCTLSGTIDEARRRVLEVIGKKV